MSNCWFKKSVSVIQRMPKYAIVCQCTLKYTKLCQNIKGNGRGKESLSKYDEVYQIVLIIPNNSKL